MAAEPVIVDDGGSTRIRQVGDKKLLDKLMTDRKDKANSFWQRAPVVKVLYLGLDGIMNEVQSRSLATARTEHVLIESSNAQRVKVEVQKQAFGWDIEISLDAPAEPPIMEARQHTPRQRRYVIVNAGSIQRVTRSSDGSTLFDITRTPSLHTMLIFS
jgi:hypothetical protein